MLKPLQSPACRRGAVAILWVFLLLFLLALAACGIDLGYLMCVQTQAQAVADAAALAGAKGLSFGAAQVQAKAQACARLNTANGQPVVLESSDVVLGTWNMDTQTFSPGGTGANAVQVTVTLTAARGNPANLFFAKVIGQNSADVTASAIAAASRWDVIFSQDISASYDTDLVNAVAGTQAGLAAFNQFSPWSYFGQVQHGGWGSTWAALQPVGPNYSTLNATIGNLTDCQHSQSPHLYNVYNTVQVPITPTTLTPDCCGSDLSTGLQQAINMFTSPEYTVSAPPGTRRAIVVSSDGESNPNPNGQNGFLSVAELNALATSTAHTAWNTYGISVFVLLYTGDGAGASDIAVLQSLVQGEGTYTQVATAAEVPTALQSIIVKNLTYNLVK